MSRPSWRISTLIAIIVAIAMTSVSARGGVTSEQVERAIREGVRFLKSQQRDDGSWPDAEAQAKTGTTSLVTLALLTAGERADSKTIQKVAGATSAGSAREQLSSTYAIGLQTMVFAAAEPERDRLRMLANVEWLERAQIKPGDRAYWPGPGPTPSTSAQAGDNSNTQYALLGLTPPARPGSPVKPEVWALLRELLGAVPDARRRLGLHARPTTPSTAQHDLRRDLQPDHLRLQAVPGAGIPPGGRRSSNCGKGGANLSLNRGIDWMAEHLHRRPELRPRPAVEVLLPLWPGAGRPARRASVSSAARLVSPGRRGTRPRPGPALRLLAGRADQDDEWSPRASRCCSWPRAARRC